MPVNPVLVAGIGNIFLGDDGFGVEVANRLAVRRRCPRACAVGDFGIRGVHSPTSCSTATTPWCSSTPCRWASRPARSLSLESDLGRRGDDRRPDVDAHSMSPAVVLGMLAGLGGDRRQRRRRRLPAATLDEGMGLTRSRPP